MKIFLPHQSDDETNVDVYETTTQFDVRFPLLLAAHDDSVRR
jgi:hypothetical protein